MSQETKGELIPGVVITITPQKAGDDPPITIYHVLIEDNRKNSKGTWSHTCGSRQSLKDYVEGIRAGGSVIGATHVVYPEFPFNDSL